VGVVAVLYFMEHGGLGRLSKQYFEVEILLF